MSWELPRWEKSLRKENGLHVAIQRICWNMRLHPRSPEVFSHKEYPEKFSFQFSRLVMSNSLWPHGLTAAHQASLSITNSWSLLKLMSIELVMPSNHPILCCSLLLLPSIFPSIRVFSNESILWIRWPSIGVSALASVLPMNIKDDVL